MVLRIATWNINSVRLRAPLLLRLMQQENPDIICLQETKTPDEHFPLSIIQDAGYRHAHFHGMPGYNGVAILSRFAFEKTEIHHRVGKQDCRHIAVQFPQFELHNLYIPAGGDEPDIAINEKFAHKLNFVEEMAAWFKENHKPDKPMIAVGDFNIAPQEHDVWSHKQLLNVVSHTPIEVAKLKAMQESLGWVDSSRHFIPENEKCYTWWSYRNKDWRKSNRGRRLDHIWVTKPLQAALKAQKILDEARDWEKPSDHVPLMVDFNF